MARTHGKYSTYTGGCRCDECREAMNLHRRAAYARKRDREGRVRVTQTADERRILGDLLQELFPFGLTDDCPAAKARRERAAA